MKRNSFTYAGCTLTAEHFDRLNYEEAAGSKKTPSSQPQSTKKPEKPKQHEQHLEEEVDTYSEEEEFSEEESSSDESDVETCTIEVTGVKKGTSLDMVKKFFSNRRRSGGGEIETAWHDEENNRYTITYTDREGELCLSYN